MLSLPAIFIGAGPGYLPTGQVLCAVIILWQPRPRAQPAVEERDVFRFSKVLKAANGIRDLCLEGWMGRRRMIGREWVEPNEWVDVQFGGVSGPEVVKGWGNSSGSDDGVVGRRGELRVILADGTNMSVLPSVFNEVRGCGGLLNLGNGTAGTID